MDKQAQAPKEQQQQQQPQYQHQQEQAPPTFRFKLDDSIVQLISCFAKTHMTDDRKTYKSEWKLYYEQNYDVFDREVHRLIELGYNNKEPIEDKMFKAGRYYFRKKNLISNKKEQEEEEEDALENDEEEDDDNKNNNINNNINKNKNNNNKIRMDRTILTSFDTHICQMPSTGKIVSPEKSYENYCKTTITEITSEIMNIYNTHHLSVSDINAKLKETYRNRYFNIIRKNSKK
jgi:hypothetical protein